MTEAVEEFGSSADADTHRDADGPVVGDWKEAATGLCAEMLKQAPVQARKVADTLYETLLDTVQDYLRDNVDYNLSADLKRAKRNEARANDALANVAVCLGVDVHGFPNYPTPEMVEDQCAVAVGKLLNQATRASAFIDGLGRDLHHRRCADWFPEGAHNAAEQMSEDMRLLGNACADFEPSQPGIAAGDEPQSPTTREGADR